MSALLATWIALSTAATPTEQRLSAELPWTRLRDQWFRVDLGDKNAGWLHIEVEQADGGVDGMQYRTLEVLNITINRGADVAHTAVETEMVEDAAGQPGTTRFVQSMAKEVIEVTTAFEADGVHITSVRGTKQQVSSAPAATEEFFGRYEAERIFLKRCTAGETDITVTTIRPELGHQLINVSRVFVEAIPAYEYVDASGAMSSAPVTVWDMQISGVSWVTREFYSSEHCGLDSVLVGSVIDSQFGELRCILTDEASAGTLLDGDGERPEMVNSLAVPLKERLRGVYSAVSATLLVRTKDKSLLDLPSCGYQSVAPELGGEDGDATQVTIDMGRPQAPLEEELETAEEAAAAGRATRSVAKRYRVPSTLLDSDDEVVQKMMKSALRKNGMSKSNPLPPVTRAHILREAVRRHIRNPDLATVFASASETARSGQGDCSEHAVLLAALLRATGIPSRTCSGLVYTEAYQTGGGGVIAVGADGSSIEVQVRARLLCVCVCVCVPLPSSSCTAAAFQQPSGSALASPRLTPPPPARRSAHAPRPRQPSFGWHMWTQAFINDAWVDLDATLPVPYSIGHVLVSTSPLEDGAIWKLEEVKQASLIGNLEIIVEATKF
jgi:hypothetical protein